jgi:SnoaL-like domain
MCDATRDVRFGPIADIHVAPFYLPRQACSHILKTKLREPLWSAWTDYSGATLVDREQENIMNIIEKSRETVEQLLARRNLPKTYEEKCQYALDLVDMHLHEENPDRIDECIKLYTEDAIWETPARNVSYRGRETIKNMYLRVFNSAEGVTFHPIERFATPDRVFDDMWATFRMSGDGFENCPFPIGTKVKMRLLHNFHIRDGMIAKEIGYEIWRRDE